MPAWRGTKTPSDRTDYAWLRSGLFWRTFFLLAFLIAVSMATWIASYRMVERPPRASQIAAQIISIVTITRTALTHSAPESRRELLFDLASNEGIRIYPREDNDIVLQPSDSGLLPLIQSAVRGKLGEDTQFASAVNGIAGFFISFTIEDDEYWLMMSRERVERTSGAQWFGWAAVTLVLSLLGAVFISRFVNLPLARLTAATRAMASGQQPEPLPEKGPREVRETNRSFNHMVKDLNRIESDRAIILAGISHDLRTPISRMLLEVEMANLDAEARSGMRSDLAQMDAIIGQFLDYAKPAGENRFVVFDVSTLIEDAAKEAGRLPDVRLTAAIDKNVMLRGDATELRRVVNNLVENARRYGKTSDGDLTEIDIACRDEGGEAVIEVGDHGVGIPEGDIDNLLRPFTRLDAARGQANGAGLGLAIVDRIAKRHSARLRLSNRPGGGLMVQLRFPAANRATVV
jgi:two-component system osmolarity sensor histidine kinase EnvZ